MKFLKLLIAVLLVAQFNAAWSQDDSGDSSWSEDTSVAPEATPMPSDDAAGESSEMPTYDDSSDY